MNRNKVGYVYVLLAAFFFALIAVIGKTVINSGIKIFDLLVLQYTASFVFMLIYFVIAGIRKLSLPKESLKAVLTQGLIGSSCTTVLFYLALEKLNAGIASMLLFTHPALVSIYFMATKTRRITRRSNLALLAAFFGSIMVINVFNIGIAGTPLIGFVFGIMSSCTYAFYNIYADVKLKDFEPLVIAFYTNLTTLAVSMILHPGFFRFEFLMTSELLIYIFELAVFQGYCRYIPLQRHKINRSG